MSIMCEIRKGQQHVKMHEYFDLSHLCKCIK